ncbi:MAG: hypothetical protein ACHQHO_10155 [Solirubrobacterales bacterium]
MDVYEYFQTREREFHDFSLVPDGDISDMFAEEAGSDGERGIMFGRVTLDERTFLSFYESIVVVGTGIHREEYSYYLIRDGLEVWGYDRDHSHNPEEHMHKGADHERHATGRVTFKEVVEKAWENVSREEELADAEVD